MKTIKRWMVQLGVWLIRKGTDAPGVPTLSELARTLVARQDRNWPDADGEFKRAKVYAQLINTFPERSRREVSKAIEKALE